MASLRWTRLIAGALPSYSRFAIASTCLGVITGLWMAESAQLAQPKAMTVLAGLAIYVAVATRSVGNEIVMRTWTVVGLSLAGVGILGTDWTAKQGVEGSWLGSIAGSLPSFAWMLPTSALAVGRAGVHPNEIAGAIVLVLPLALLFVRQPSGAGPWRILAAIVPVGLATTLVLTQSRGGLLGIMVAGGTLGLWMLTRGSRAEGRRLQRVFALTLPGLAVLSAIVFVGGAFLGQVEAGSEPQVRRRVVESIDIVLGGNGSGVSRIALWNRAWRLIGDVPLTGVGLNQFDRVVHRVYPDSYFDPELLTAHVHNFVAQVVLDAGFFGLLAIVSLIGGLTIEAIRAGRVDRQAAGSLAGLVGLFGFGAVDALAVGAKPWLLIWLLFALARDRSTRTGSHHQSAALHVRWLAPAMFITVVVVMAIQSDFRSGTLAVAALMGPRSGWGEVPTVVTGEWSRLVPTDVDLRNRAFIGVDLAARDLVLSVDGGARYTLMHIDAGFLDVAIVVRGTIGDGRLPVWTLELRRDSDSRPIARADIRSSADTLGHRLVFPITDPGRYYLEARFADDFSEPGRGDRNVQVLGLSVRQGAR
jgi:O-antigen ligase